MKINITSLFNAEVYDHPVKKLELIETHISWVILTGDFAYKIKKPVNFGFLDFSTLENRHLYCQQEILLNSRLAGEIYLGVVSITGTSQKLKIASENTIGAFEYAVKMVQFPQEAQLDNMLEAGHLGVEHMDSIAHMVARFHQTIPNSIGNQKAETYGTKEANYQLVDDNFSLSLDQIKQHSDLQQYRASLIQLRHWAFSKLDQLSTKFEERKEQGFVRECHGDMHLRNMVWLNNKPMAFDCIEFNPEISWSDVISEVAFTVMDLQDRNEFLLANRFLNTYLEDTGDYDGLHLMCFYLCHRAMVRVKVSALSLENETQTDKNNKADSKALEQRRQAILNEFKNYLALANSYSEINKPKLVIMRGMSASGKSTLSQQILDKLGAIRIRSDVERKRMFSDESNTKEIKSGIYSKDASELTYQKLSELGQAVIEAGYTVIIDAAFLKYKQREMFKSLAKKLDVGFVILNVTASNEELRKRIVARKNDISDADLSVLEYQIANTKPLDDQELKNVITLDTETNLDIKAISNQISNA